MKKLLLMSFTLSALAAGLIGCGNRAAVGTAGGTAAGAGIGLAATGTPVGAAVGAGVGALVGQEATDEDVVVYRRDGVVHHHGHSYHIRNGRYVLVR